MIIWLSGPFGGGKRPHTAAYRVAAVTWLHHVGNAIDTTALTPDETLQRALPHHLWAHGGPALVPESDAR
ncbi:hypothetical protein AB0D66_21750 [Streptomyces sp. NPDC048270]|uniref:hypothetical protein n=1 Tax=Streptomyces sp. NPDC048270 TaxID=3154615 RepID=UPI0033C33A13